MKTYEKISIVLQFSNALLLIAYYIMNNKKSAGNQPKHKKYYIRE